MSQKGQSVNQQSDTQPTNSHAIAQSRAKGSIQIDFEGWFQCRIATDPDPPDEPRGISGESFAAAGEPDLDGLIQFQSPNDRVVRRHGPPIGVQVTAVTVDGRAIGHPLRGGSVRLLNEPRFQEQDGAISPRNTAFIDPFDFEISRSGRTLLRRRALWDPRRPNLQFYDADETELQQRRVKDFKFNQPDVLAKISHSSGTDDERKRKFLHDRLSLLRTDLDRADKLDTRLALEQRIRTLEQTDWQREKMWLLLAVKVSYQFTLNGVPTVVDIPGVDLKTPWPIAFWMGAWDNDALCGYVKGTLEVPKGVDSPAKA